MSGTNAYPITASARGESFDSVQVLPSNKVIALTFDDGPQPGNTEQILAILAQNNVKATFFQVGQNLAQYPDLGRSVRDGGNAIGNHSWSHQENPADPAAEVHQADAEFQTVYGGPTALFRPPYGDFDNGVVPIAMAENDAVITWSVDPEDWNMPGTDVIVNTVLNGATPGGIVLMHDGGGDRTQTIAALPRIIAGLKAQGYRLVTVPELLAIGAGEVTGPTPTPGPPGTDNTPPTLTITTPGSGYSYNSVDAIGTAIDTGAGLSNVDASLKRFTDNFYWNGTVWAAAPASLAAQINVNNWKLPLSFLADGRYSVLVAATDKANNVSPAIAREFWVDNVAPTTTISAPLTNTTVTTLATATGTAVDVGSGIGSVSTALVRVSDGFWWNGTSWTSNYTETKATLTGSNWSFKVPALTAGAYIFYAQSLDFVGNVGPWVSSNFTYSGSTTVATQAKVQGAAAPAPSAPRM